MWVSDFFFFFISRRCQNVCFDRIRILWAVNTGIFEGGRAEKRYVISVNTDFNTVTTPAVTLKWLTGLYNAYRMYHVCHVHLVHTVESMPFLTVTTADTNASHHLRREITRPGHGSRDRPKSHVEAVSPSSLPVRNAADNDQKILRVYRVFGLSCRR